MLPALVSRIKIMGSMNIAESRLPQDGSEEFSWQDKKLDLRISSFPVYEGL
jgi:type II secretory ATPase GspE/PulE/Tfp pilus assembly ATPase PilB-like protein